MDFDYHYSSKLLIFSKKIMRQLILSAAVVLLAVTFGESQEKYEHHSSYKIDPSGTVYLDCEDAEVYIKSGSQDEVVVDVIRQVSGELVKRPFDIDYKSENGHFYMTEKKSTGLVFSWSGGTIVKYTIELTIPYGASLNIIGEDDDYYIDNLGGDIELQAEDGTVRITACTSKKMAFQLEDGDVILKQVGADLRAELEDGDVICYESNLGNVEIEIEDGDVTFSESSARDINIKSSDGDVNLDKVDGDVTIETDDGDISIDELRSYYADLKTTDGDIIAHLVTKNEGSHKLSSEDGDIALRISGAGAQIEIDIEDGDVSANSNYDYLKKKEHYKMLHTRPSGQTKVQISTIDGDVRLK